MSDDCELCRARAGLHHIDRLCCCLRLVRATPPRSGLGQAPHGARAAMWAHLQRSLDEAQWTSLRAAWDEARRRG